MPNNYCREFYAYALQGFHPLFCIGWDSDFRFKWWWVKNMEYEMSKRIQNFCDTYAVRP